MITQIKKGDYTDMIIYFSCMSREILHPKKQGSEGQDEEASGNLSPLRKIHSLKNLPRIQIFNLMNELSPTQCF